MNLLQFFFIISGVVILIIALDVSKKQRFNALHFLVFLWVWVWLLVFTFFHWVLNSIWNLFWIARWADVLVYASIIFLLYFVLLLLLKHVENKESITNLIRELAIENSEKKIIDGDEVFLIPAYNEWKVILDTLDNLIKSWYKNILLVNDWSKDDTRKKVTDFWNKIILLNHLKNRGQWSALETWFEYIRRYWNVKYIVTFDADWQHDIKDYINFKKYLEENKNVDIALWSRFLWEQKSKVPFSRKLILKLGILFTFFISKIKLTDAHNWFRVIRKNVLNDLKITIEWMWHASEIVDIISEKNIKYIEMPVNIIYTEYSLSKWQKSSNAINIALRFIWSKFFR